MGQSLRLVGSVLIPGSQQCQDGTESQDGQLVMENWTTGCYRKITQDNDGKTQIIVESVGWVYGSSQHYSFFLCVFPNFSNKNIKNLKEQLFQIHLPGKENTCKIKHLGKMQWYLTRVLICISFLTNNVKHLYMCFLDICIIFLAKQNSKAFSQSKLIYLSTQVHKGSWQLYSKYQKVNKINNRNISHRENRF